MEVIEPISGISQSRNAIFHVMLIVIFAQIRHRVAGPYNSLSEFHSGLVKAKVKVIC